MEENVSMWNKKADELTLSENIKGAAVATVVLTGASMAIFAVIGGGIALAEKIRIARQNRKDKKDQ